MRRFFFGLEGERIGCGVGEGSVVAGHLRLEPALFLPERKSWGESARGAKDRNLHRAPLSAKTRQQRPLQKHNIPPNQDHEALFIVSRLFTDKQKKLQVRKAKFHPQQYSRARGVVEPQSLTFFHLLPPSFK